MSKVPIINMQGEKTGDYEIADNMLVLKRGAQAVHDVVTAYRAGIRRGTASTLNKGLVSGSNIKPWQQKGLGRARAGYRQSPIWRGGGVVFGPRPRLYDKKVTKKVSSLAFSRLLSEKVTNGSLKVLTELAVADGKTAQFAELLKNLKTTGKALFLVEKLEENLKRASRNIPGIEVSLAVNANVYQLMLYKNIFVTKAAMELLLERLNKTAVT
jgi:large subunit ribosomal protein L4